MISDRSRSKPCSSFRKHWDENESSGHIRQKYNFFFAYIQNTICHKNLAMVVMVWECYDIFLNRDIDTIGHFLKEEVDMDGAK